MIAELSRAVRLGVVVRHVSQIVFMLAVLTLVPLAVSLWFHEYGVMRAYLVVLGVLAVASLPTFLLPAAERLQSNEGLVITALAFVISPLVMCYPMMASGLTPVDAFFEAVSGVTTTGLSTLADVNAMPHTFLFARAWMQWYGGLGIVVLSVALLMGHGMIARRLAQSEAPIENLVTSTRTHARRMLLAYSALTAIGIIAVWAAGAPPFEAVLHVFASVSTGGFSSYQDSLAGFGSWGPPMLIIILSICGASVLPLYYQTTQGGVRRLLADREFVALLVGGLLISALLTFFLWRHMGLPGRAAAAHALLIGFSAQTTTGFTSLPIEELQPAAKAVLLASMLVGGSVGSTAGGIKVWRFLIMLSVIRLVVQRVTVPRHAVVETTIGGRRIEDEEVTRALLLGALYIMVIFISWLPFLAMGYDPLDTLFEVVSAVATVGLSTGITAPELHPALKLVLCADMLLGRLEVVAFLVLFYPLTWFGRRLEHE